MPRCAAGHRSCHKAPLYWLSVIARTYFVGPDFGTLVELCQDHQLYILESCVGAADSPACRVVPGSPKLLLVRADLMQVLTAVNVLFSKRFLGGTCSISFLLQKSIDMWCKSYLNLSSESLL